MERFAHFFGFEAQEGRFGAKKRLPFSISFLYRFLLDLGCFLDPFCQPFWSIFAVFAATSIFHDFFFVLASMLGSISASKVSILLRTSFKNHEMCASEKNTSHGPFLDSIFDSKSMQKPFSRDMKV